MRHGVFLALLAASFLSVEPAWAQTADRYQLLALLDDTAVFVDTRTIVREGSEVSSWVLGVRTTESDQDIDAFKSRETFNCSKFTYSVESIIGYIKGTTLSREEPNTGLLSITPNTLPESIMDYLCRGVVPKDFVDFDLFSEAEAAELRDVMQEDANAARD